MKRKLNSPGYFLKDNLKKHKEILYLIARNLSLLYILFLILEITNLFLINLYINFNLFFFIVLLFDIPALIVYFNFEKNTEKLSNLVKYLFLIFLVIITLLEFEPISKYLSFLTGYKTHLFILTIVFGTVTFWQNREVITKIERESTEEEKQEQKRKKEFGEKFPRINKIPIFRNIVKWMYKEGWWYVLGLILIYFVFVLIQLYKIYHTGIGTDEGNFLFTTKLLLSGKTLFLDFWSRESGSLIFLIPWFRFFELNIINLRYFIFFIHSIIFFLFYFTMKEISHNKKKILFILVLTISVLQFNSVFDMFQGIFYQMSFLFYIIIFYIVLIYYFKNNNKLSYILFIGLLTGLSILIYKGSQIFLVIIPLITIIKNQENIKKMYKHLISFFIISFIPIISYWVYYSFKTDFYHMYKILLNDVFLNLFLIILFYLIVSFIFFKKQFRGYFSKLNLILLTNLFVVGAFIYRFIQNSELLSFSFYSGLILSFSFIIIIIQLINLSVASKYKKAIFFLYLLINLSLLVFGFGGEGFFTNVGFEYHVIATSIFLIYNLALVFIVFKNKIEYKDDKIFYFAIFFNLWLGISSIGGYLIPTRFQTIMIFTPIMFLAFSLIKIKLKYLLYFIITSSLIFSIFLNIGLPNDYTLYGYEDFKKTINYIDENLDENKYVFSADTSILSEIKNPSIIFFHSPFHFRETEDIYFYDGLKQKYNSDISLTKKEILEKLKKQKPTYILGSWRSTFRIFEDIGWKEFLDNNYKLNYRSGRIKIYKLKIHL